MATRSVKKAGTEFKKTTASVKKSTAAIDKTVAATSKSSSGFKKLASDIGKVALGVNQSLGVLRSFRGVLDSTAGGLLRAHDANVVALNSIRPFTESVEEATLVHNMFRESAINTGVGVEALSDTFKNLRVATESAGFGVGKVVGLTQDLAKTLRASGTTVGAASGALRQLGQAFSAGALRGEEFNSIMENMALLATGLEVSLGVGRGELRALAMQGKITSDALSDAIEIAGEKADKIIKGMAATFSTLGTSMSTVLGQAVEGSTTFEIFSSVVESFDKSLKSGNKAIAEFISILIDTVSGIVAVGAALATYFVIKKAITAVVVAFTFLKTALVAARVAMIAFNLTNPIGWMLTLTTLVASVTKMFGLWGDEAEEVSKKVDGLTQDVKKIDVAFEHLGVTISTKTGLKTVYEDLKKTNEEIIKLIPNAFIIDNMWKELSKSHPLQTFGGFDLTSNVYNEIDERVAKVQELADIYEKLDKLKIDKGLLGKAKKIVDQEKINALTLKEIELTLKSNGYMSDSARLAKIIYDNLNNAKEKNIKQLTQEMTLQERILALLKDTNKTIDERKLRDRVVEGAITQAVMDGNVDVVNELSRGDSKIDRDIELFDLQQESEKEKRQDAIEFYDLSLLQFQEMNNRVSDIPSIVSGFGSNLYGRIGESFENKSFGLQDVSLITGDLLGQINESIYSKSFEGLASKIVGESPEQIAAREQLEAAKRQLDATNKSVLPWLA